jgi:hypothetical protein
MVMLHSKIVWLKADSGWHESAVCSVLSMTCSTVTEQVAYFCLRFPPQFLTALKQIGSLVNIGNSASTSSGGIFGLLNAFQTISSATTSTATGSRGLLADSTASDAGAVNNLLNAVRTVGDLLVGSSATTTTAAPSMGGLLQSGMGLITSLSKFIPLSGASVNLNLASILSLLQYTGSFFSQLTALLPRQG